METLNTKLGEISINCKVNEEATADGHKMIFQKVER